MSGVAALPAVGVLAFSGYAGLPLVIVAAGMIALGASGYVIRAAIRRRAQ